MSNTKITVFCKNNYSDVEGNMKLVAIHITHISGNSVINQELILVCKWWIKIILIYLKFDISTYKERDNFVVFVSIRV